MKKPTLNLYCKSQNELIEFLERFYNKKFDKSMESFTFDNPIEMIDLASAIIDNNDKYEISRLCKIVGTLRAKNVLFLFLFISDVFLDSWTV